MNATYVDLTLSLKVTCFKATQCFVTSYWNLRIFLYQLKLNINADHRNIVTCRPISRQRPKYTHTTIEKVLQEVFYMWSALFPLLGNVSLNTFPQKETRRTIGHLLLSNAAVNTVFSVGSVTRSYKGTEKTRRSSRRSTAEYTTVVESSRFESRNWQLQNNGM
jgi:hypothetical protein